MNASDFHVSAGTADVPASADRAAWVAPAITRIEAGSAENAAGPAGDDPVNFS